MDRSCVLDSTGCGVLDKRDQGSDDRVREKHIHSPLDIDDS